MQVKKEVLQELIRRAFNLGLFVQHNHTGQKWTETEIREKEKSVVAFVLEDINKIKKGA